MPPEQPTRHLFVCNGAQITTRKKIWRELHPTELITDGVALNVRIGIAGLYEQFSTNICARALDLIEIASAVLIADQTASRTTHSTQGYGDKWYREIRMEIAVREPEFWGREEVTDQIVGLLNFISGDTFQFGFSEQEAPSPVESFFEFKSANSESPRIDKVILFSGGIDSLGGALQEIRDRRRIAMVCHRPAGGSARLQKHLADQLILRARQKEQDLMPITVTCYKLGCGQKAHILRAGTLWYVAVGAVVAQALGLGSVEFFQNGVSSINLPLAGHEYGARAARSGHPQALERYAHLFSLIFDREFHVQNGFIWKTKQEVVDQIHRYGHGDLVASSVSCERAGQGNQQKSHCGLCSRCIARRLATLGVDNGALDPSGLYRRDVLSEPIESTQDRTIAERFVGFSREIEAMDSSADFIEKYAEELSRVSKHFPIETSKLYDKIFDLHRRYAEQLNAVMINGMRASVSDQFYGKVIEGSLLSFAFGGISGFVRQDVGGSHAPPATAGTLNRNRVLSKNQLVILQILAKANALMYQSDIASATEARGRRLSTKTIGAELRELFKREFVCRPSGERSGVEITPMGREYLADTSAD